MRTYCDSAEPPTGLLLLVIIQKQVLSKPIELGREEGTNRKPIGKDGRNVSKSLPPHSKVVSACSNIRV